MACSCGNDHFSANQVQRHTIIVDDQNNWQENKECYDAETPFGIYACTKCGTEYENIPTGEKAQRRIIAVFHPQTWINDYAVPVDPEGPVSFDITAEILRMGKTAALGIKEDQYESDELRLVPNAPQWVRDWYGPFWVECEENIRTYLVGTDSDDILTTEKPEETHVYLS